MKTRNCSNNSNGRRNTLQPYTVLLKVPEKLTGGFLETVYAHVQAPAVQEAIAEARQQVPTEYAEYVEDFGLVPEDWIVLMVIEGHHDDVRLNTESSPS